ncbi:hypothetical protein [Geoalkalibacter halelectricus]|uniref:hypothetical protein n=1 Tax=Geoalkalibacter halelectricus TaxID=2847045 RepID=UPI003D224136
MKNFRNLLIGLTAAAALTLAGCGGSSSSGPAPGPDPDPTPVQNTVFSDPITLNGLPGGTFSAGITINAEGLAVGIVTDADGMIRGAKWQVTDENPQVTALDPLTDNVASAAYGINRAGTAVGESQSATTAVAVMWDEDGAITSLPVAGHEGPSAAYSINDLGLVVGESSATAEGNSEAVLWDLDNGTITSLHQTGWEFSAAYYVHHDGLIVGEAKPLNGNRTGVIWTPAGEGQFEVLLLAPADNDPNATSVAFGVDQFGRVIGETEVDGVVYGTIWAVNAVGDDLEDAAQVVAENVSLQAINDSDRIVGYSAALSGNDRAGVWNLADTEDSQNVAAAFSQAYGVNSATQIVGVRIHEDAYQAFAVIPVVEE